MIGENLLSANRDDRGFTVNRVHFFKVHSLLSKGEIFENEYVAGGICEIAEDELKEAIGMSIKISFLNITSEGDAKKRQADEHKHEDEKFQLRNIWFVDVLQEAPLSGHRQPRNIFGSLLYCILLVGYTVVAAAAPWIFFVTPKLIPALLCSCNAILLVITGIFQQYLVYQVRKVRLQGYYLFSEKLKHIARLPFATIAYGTGLMLLILVWQPHLQILSVSTLLRIAMFAEVIIVGCFMSVYIGCIHQYNSLNGQPDILKSLYSALQPSSSLEGLRYHDGGRLTDQQMALLQYQRENLHYLSEEVLRLQELLSKYQRSDDGTAQVDLAHLLATRDQELRTLSAEMNQLHSELRLARNLIAERDNEIQQIRLTNNQYVEENERVRAILSEWSSRSAKLERALELERLSKLELQKSFSLLKNQSSSQENVDTFLSSPSVNR